MNQILDARYRILAIKTEDAGMGRCEDTVLVAGDFSNLQHKAFLSASDYSLSTND